MKQMNAKSKSFDENRKKKNIKKKKKNILLKF